MATDNFETKSRLIKKAEWRTKKMLRCNLPELPVVVAAEIDGLNDEEPGQPLRVSLGHVFSPRKIWLGLILFGQRCNENKGKKKITKSRRKMIKIRLLKLRSFIARCPAPPHALPTPGYRPTLKDPPPRIHYSFFLICDFAHPGISSL